MAANEPKKAMSLQESLESLFQQHLDQTSDQLISKDLILSIQRQAWLGNMSSESTRALCWRLFLGILKSQSYMGWCSELKKSFDGYEDLKRILNPPIDEVSDDPLSSLAAGDGKQSAAWAKYYKNMETANLIRVDLDRLFMPGITEDYFQESARKERILTVLFLWSVKYERIGYRQGMHELVGTISYVLDVETEAWRTCPTNHPLKECFCENHIEAHLFWLFDRLMIDLVDLYDPIPVKNAADSVPHIVDYCTRIQEHFLRQIDPELCDRLEDAFIQGQIYGLRWARLLLGREFPLSHTQSLRIWDYMFASCMNMDTNAGQSSVVFEELNSAQSSVSSAVRVLRERYGSYSPLMGVLGDFMIAMLLHIREDIVKGDSNEVLGLLMKYPAVENVTPIMDLADMLRRGVLNCGAHLGPPPMKTRQKFLKLTGRLSPHGARANAFLPPQSNSSSQPAWSLTNPILPVLNSSTLNHIGRRMTEQMSAVSSAVKSSNSWRMLEDPSVDTNVDPLLGSAVKNKQTNALMSPTKNLETMPTKSEVIVNTARDVRVSSKDDDVMSRLVSRLGNVAEMLSESTSTIHEDIQSVEGVSPALLLQIKHDDELKMEAARRIRLLTAVAMGAMRIEEYDSQINVRALRERDALEEISDQHLINGIGEGEDDENQSRGSRIDSVKDATADEELVYDLTSSISL